MKQLWKQIVDGLTFTDLAGHRRPRQYAIVAGIILFIALTLGGASWVNQLLLKYSMKETFAPVTENTQTPLLPTETAQATALPCPVLSEQWSLSDPVIKQNYKVIQPACVYDGLAHTVAWALAVRNGYSREQARQLLGFSELPMRQMDHVAIPDSADQPQDVAVSFIPPTLDFVEWRVNDQGKPAVAYGLRGCFRTSNVVGNKVEIWGGEYPVICVVVEDAANTHIVYRLGEHIFTNEAVPTRSFLLFGYVGDGYWVWLGTQDNPKMNIEDFAETDNERLTVALLFDSKPWDLAWLQSRYGMSQQPLPDGWQNFNDPMEQQIILDELINGIMVTP
ncbi:MAG TPA: hypothetical protein PLN86_04555 [Candidatus Hydrogenedentes bacterium]|nr:hypothetical protein [Candidatus Hydrogenedentota bacterium]